MDDQELEVKYFVSNLIGVREKLERLKAEPVQERVLEVNLRFDTETNQLARGFKVLRLRYDKKTRLTFKGPASDQDGVRLRKEIEFEVSFSAWAYKVLELNILAHYRKKGNERKRFGEIPENDDLSTAITPYPELKRRLLDCLRKLNERNIRHTRILNFSYQGYDMDQICEKLNTTKTAAYILLSRARTKLKECINTGSLDHEMPR